MFYIYFIYLTFVIPLPLTQQYTFDSESKEERDKILSKWLGVEIDGAYFFDWTTREVKQTAESSKTKQQAELKEENEVWTRESPKRFISDPPDDCFPVQERRRSSTADFMRMLQQKCWDDLLPVNWECSAHSGAERANTPANCYHILTHVAAFLIVAKLLYMLWSVRDLYFFNKNWNIKLGA